MYYKNSKIIVCILALSVLLSGCSADVEEKSTDQKIDSTPEELEIPKVKVARIEEKSLFETLSYIGTTKIDTEINITARTEGVVQNVYVKSGDIVKKGDILFDLRDPNGESSPEINFELVNNNYQNVKKTYDNIKNKNDETLKGSELALEIAKLNLLNTEETLNRTKLQNEFLIKTTIQQLENSKKNIDRVRQTAGLTEQRIGTNRDSTLNIVNISLDNTYRFLEISLLSTLPTIITTINNTPELPSGASRIERDLENLQDDFDDINNNDISGLNYLILGAQDLVSDLIDYLLKEDVQRQLGTSFSSIKISLDTLASQLQGQNSGLANTENTLRSLSVNDAAQIQPVQQQIAGLSDQLVILETAIESTRNQTALSQHALNSSISLLRKDIEAKSIAQNITKIASKMEIEQTETQLKNLELQLKQAKIQMGYLEVKAEIDGVINKVNSGKGQLVSNGTPLATLFSQDKKSVVISVNSKDLLYLKQGQKVSIINKLTNRNTTGVISKIAPAADLNSHLIPIEITLEKADELIIPNTIFEIQIDIPLPKKNIYVPLNSVLIRADENYVFTVENNIVKKKKVELGTINDTSVIINQGLSFGEMLVIEGQSKLEEGTKVKIIMEKNTPKDVFNPS